MTYNGSCHCGRIAFEVEGTVQQVIECNCSICIRRGHLLWFVPREKVRLSTPVEAMTTYRFNTHTIKHNFCPVCGCAPFGEGTDRSGVTQAAVNVRCLDGIRLASLQIKKFDGRSLPLKLPETPAT